MHKKDSKVTIRFKAISWATAGLAFAVFALPFIVVSTLANLITNWAMTPYKHALDRVAFWLNAYSSLNQQFLVGDAVLYVPEHAAGNVFHRDCERGTVTAVRTGGIVFVRFRGASAQEVPTKWLQLIQRPAA